MTAFLNTLSFDTSTDRKWNQNVNILELKRRGKCRNYQDKFVSTGWDKDGRK